MVWLYELAQDREIDPTIQHWAVAEAGGGGACPVQHWGTFTNGWRFYFRFRSNYARLNVAPPGTPMNRVPLVNPRWDAEAAAEAYQAEIDYPHNPWWGPAGRVDEVYPNDPLVGCFESEDDLNTTFAACFEQVKNQIGLGDMVCPDCKTNKHDACRGESWCDCQHRAPSPALPKPTS